MKVSGISGQHSDGLDEYFASFSQNEDESTRERAKAMLRLISRLRVVPEKYLVYVETGIESVDDWILILRCEDNVRSPGHVQIRVGVGSVRVGPETGDGLKSGKHSYFVVKYRMPERLEPWPNAIVNGGCADAPNDAIPVILIAMNESEGWGPKTA